MKTSTKKPAKKKFCTHPECKSEASMHGFCRLHYIANWQNRKSDAKDKAERRLNAYVDRLAKKYPKDYLEKIKEGLESEEKFNQTVEELDLENQEGENPETEREFLEKFVRTNIKGED